MKLKYYLRGMGIGIILTALVMGFALGGRKSSLSDAEVIERAKGLGMIEGTQGVLSDYSNEEISGNETSSASTSDTALDEAGKEISKEVNQEVALSDKSVQEVAGEKKEREDTNAENDSSASKASTTSKKEVADASDTQSSKSATSEASANPDSSAKETTSVSNPPAESPNETTADAPSAQNTASYTTSTTITVTIPGGLGSDAVAVILYNNGVVDNAYSFNRYLIDRGKDRVIRSGTKVIPAGSSYEDIANIICK